MTELKRLHLDNNGIESDIVEEMVIALGKNPLKSLSLAFNPLHKRGRASVARYLRHNTSLTSVNLHETGYDDTQLLDALTSNTTILHAVDCFENKQMQVDELCAANLVRTCRGVACVVSHVMTGGVSSSLPLFQDLAWIVVELLFGSDAMWIKSS